MLNFKSQTYEHCEDIGEQNVFKNLVQKTRSKYVFFKRYVARSVQDSRLDRMNLHKHSKYYVCKIMLYSKMSKNKNNITQEFNLIYISLQMILQL